MNITALRLAAGLLLALALGACSGPGPQFTILSGSENDVLEPMVQEFCKSQNATCTVKYQGSLDIALSLKPGNDPEAASRPRQLPHACAVALLEERLDVEAERQLDRFARRARRRDHDHAPRRRLRPHECVVVGEVGFSNVSNHAAEPSRFQPSALAEAGTVENENGDAPGIAVSPLAIRKIS